MDAEDQRLRKAIFDNAWTLVIVVAAVWTILSWYLGLTQLDIAPIIWTLASLAGLQFGLQAGAERAGSPARLARFAFASQVAGVAGMGLAWHLDGGLQQPAMALLLLMPLFCSTLALNFWQQQISLILVLGVFLSGALLSVDTNSFIAERYGLDIVSSQWLPGWIPRSRQAFADVNTSPTYNLMLVGTMAILALVLHATSRQIVGLVNRFMSRLHSLRLEGDRAQLLATRLVSNAPGSEVLVASGSGRILHASERFLRTFDLPQSAEGSFLLDAVRFAYPGVIKRLMNTGGDEIQGATLHGREVVLQVRARLIDVEPTPVVRISIETCEEICWRGSVDALQQPVFAINSHGTLVFLNRSAKELLGAEAEGSAASAQFAMDAAANRWWDIAPLESARRMLDLRGRRYLASIRRERIAASIGELSFVHLHERDHVNAVAVA
jgi:PAS domain-containing protein